MRPLLSLLRRFRSDERGVFGVLFTVMAIVIIAMAGAAVDFVSVEQARTRAQLALDSAALALQAQIYTKTTTQLKTQAQALLVERVADSTITTSVETVTVNTTSGSLNIRAKLIMPTTFVSLVGVPSLTSVLVSEATRKKVSLEVVMVLDNSNSMSSSSRMTNLIAAAKCAENILFNDNCSSTASTATTLNVKIGIVPFTMEVNVGTGNANASWIDRTGSGSTNITTNNFDSDDDETNTYGGNVDRIALFSKMKYNNSALSWGGCVEARKSPYDTNDVTPTSSNVATMFTPYFAPDEPDSGSFSNDYISDSPSACVAAPKCVLRVYYYNCRSDGSNCNGGYDIDYQYTLRNSSSSWTNNSCLNNRETNYEGSNTVSSVKKSYSSNSYTYTVDYTYSYPRAMQERICKYTNSALKVSPSQASARGPNSDCPVNPITPLTATKSAVTAAINALAPQGGTNIHEGTAWGFRVLSPTLPFTEGLPYDTNTSKVMIIMTDGDNTAYQTNNMNNSGFYSAYGFPYNRRMGDSNSSNDALEAEMNDRTEATCEAAKSAGITIYTVGLSATNSSSIQMLKNCSSGNGYWYFPTSASQLTSVFQDIANTLSALRLAK